MWSKEKGWRRVSFNFSLPAGINKSVWFSCKFPERCLLPHPVQLTDFQLKDRYRHYYWHIPTNPPTYQQRMFERANQAKQFLLPTKCYPTSLSSLSDYTGGSIVKEYGRSMANRYRGIHSHKIRGWSILTADWGPPKVTRYRVIHWYSHYERVQGDHLSDYLPTHRPTVPNFLSKCYQL